MSVENAQANVDVVHRWWAGLNDTGMPSLELCDERIEIRNPPDSMFAAVYRGHDGVRKWRDDLLEIIDESRIEPEHVVDLGDGETVVMLLVSLGKARYTQISFRVEWAAVFTIRAGKVTHTQGYMDRSEALAAAGLTE